MRYLTYPPREGIMTYGEIWTYRQEADWAGDIDQTDLVGFSVEAEDGSIGKVDEATYEAGSSYLVVDTGPWIFGQKVVLPAGVVTSVDYENESVFVNRTKDQIKDAPPFEETSYREQDYHDQLGSYYGPEGPGYREW
jgi:hypothetical protein